MPRCEMCGEWPDCTWETDPEIMCGEYHPKPMTNADRIRSMTDEELAEWIYSVQDEDELRKGNFLLPLSKEWWLDWLKSEVPADG